MVLVRLLLALAFAVIAVAVALYLVTRDRRYLRFIGRVAMYTVFLLLAVLLFYAVQRFVGSS